MRSVTQWLAILFALALTGCAKPIPPERSAYVGAWHGTDMTLLISQEGQVSYKRFQGGVNASINAPLKEFEGNNFVVGLGPMATTFVVSVAPHQEGDIWTMTVDEVELTRK